MPKLFEFYVWRQLKKQYTKVYFQEKFGDDKPDFIVKDERSGIIIDAKYKHLKKGGIEGKDLGQVSKYGRNVKIRQFLSSDINKEPKLIIAFPAFIETKCLIKPVDNYHKVFVLFVGTPYLPA